MNAYARVERRLIEQQLSIPLWFIAQLVCILYVPTCCHLSASPPSFSMNSIQVFYFIYFFFVLVKSFHPSQHDIRRYIKAWGGYFSVGCCCWSGGNVSIESEETDRPNGLVASALWFQRTNETPLSVLTQKNEDTIPRVYRDGSKKRKDHHKS